METMDDLISRIAELTANLTPEKWAELLAYTDHLLATQKPVEQPMEPAEFSQLYHARQELST